MFRYPSSTLENLRNVPATGEVRIPPTPGSPRNMFSFFRQSFRKWARSGTKSASPHGAGRKPQCEALEDRVLLSLSGVETLINTTKPGVQHQAASATSTTGSSVVV